MKDFYYKYNTEDVWCIKENGFEPDIQGIRETQFAVGNGFLGARGVLEELPEGAQPGTYIAGIYDRITSQVAEIVNFPNPFFLKFTVKGEKVGAAAMDSIEHQRILNMKDGLLLRRTVYSDVKKRRYDYQSIRFLSMHNKNIGVMQIALTPLDDKAEIELQSLVDVGVVNSGTVTEGDKRHFLIKELQYTAHSIYRVIETLEKHEKVIYRSGFYYQIAGKKKFASENALSIKLKKNQTAVFTKIFYIENCGDKEKSLAAARRTSKVKFNKAFRGKFESLLKEHAAAWHKLWDKADIAIKGTNDIQKNLRFNIFHMLVCAQYDKGYSSVGARTLSGEGYRGHIFWDAEIFMLPFYAYVYPQAAKNMLLYRYRRLDQARKIAKEQGYKGAMFPWESAGTGEEETPTWAKDLDGSIIRIRTNEFEHHITADIAYACNLYYEITNDTKFMRDFGYEIILETARFWASRVQRTKGGKYGIKGVIGPDEFHEKVNNNAYTNYLAKWNLSTAHKLLCTIQKNDKTVYRRLMIKLGITPLECSKWKTIANKIIFNIRKDHVIEQFDGFFRRKHIKVKDFDENGIPMLPRGVDLKDYNKTQFVKQADVLMLIYLFSHSFQDKVKDRNFWYYSERTLHKSSLSAAMHALVALDVKALSQAYRFFNVALRADISNLHGNSSEGMHAASLGGVWQSVVHGFAGTRVNDNTLVINPFMPKTWRSIKFTILWDKNVARIRVSNDNVRLKINSGQKRKIRVKIFGKSHLVNANKEFTFERKKPGRLEDYY